MKEFQEDFLRIINEVSPFWALLRSDDVDGHTGICFFGGEFTVDPSITDAEHVKRVFHMKIKSLGLFLNRACLLGDDLVPALPRGGPVQVSLGYNNFDDRGQKIAQRKEVFNFPATLPILIGPPTFETIENGFKVDCCVYRRK